MRIILLFVANAGLNLALGLAIAALLGPGGYGRFAIASTVSVVLSLALFDWLRLSATRFYGNARRDAEPDLRSTLDACYLALAVLLGGVTGVALCSGVSFGLGLGLLAAAAFGGLANGAFEYYAALARARFLDRSYAMLLIVKNVLSIGLGVGVALITRDAALVAAATAFGALAALLPVHRGLSDETSGLRLASTARLGRMAAYGFPVVAANILFQVVTLINRGTVAGSLGFADAGVLSLATDLGFRLFLAVGSAIDVFLFQIAVRAEAERGPAAAAAQLRRNAVIVIAVLSLLAVGYAMAMPAFQAVLVPPQYRGGFAAASLVLLPGLFLFCIGQFALNPLFQVAGRTGILVAAAGLALGADALGLLIVPRTTGVIGMAAVHAASLVLSTLALLGIAVRRGAPLPGLGEIARIALAAAATALALWPLRGVEPAWLSLLAAGVVGPAVFGAVLLALDVSGVRGLAVRAVAGRRPPAPQRA